MGSLQAFTQHPLHMGLPWHNSGITPSQLSGQHIYHDLGPISAVKVHLSGIQKSWDRQESLSFWARAAGSLGWETARLRACSAAQSCQRGGRPSAPASPRPLAPVETGRSEFQGRPLCCRQELVHFEAPPQQKPSFLYFLDPKLRGQGTTRELALIDHSQPPVKDFLVLGLKCGVLCHRSPQYLIQETLHPPVTRQSPKKRTIHLPTGRFHP